MVSTLAFYSDDLSSNPAEVFLFCELFDKNEIKQKEAEDGPLLKKVRNDTGPW